MTREERHIAVLNRMLESMDVYDSIQPTTERKKAIKAAIKALSQQPCERFEWSIDGNIYKITKAKDGKEICQQVCNDAISRQAVLDTISELNAISFYEAQEDSKECYYEIRQAVENMQSDYNPEELISLFSKRIKDLPSVNPQASEHFIDGVHAMGYREGYKDAQKQKSGKWLHKEITDDYRVTGQCSECKERRIIDNFCPNCSAKMQESEDKE